MPSIKNTELKKEYEELLQKNSNFIFTRFRGLSVEKTMELKTIVRKENLQYKVIKNTIFNKALESVGNTQISKEYLKGPIAVVFANDELPAVAKKLKTYSKKNKEVSSFMAFFGGEVFSSEAMVTIENLPTQKEVLTQIARTVQAPVFSIATLLQNVLSSVMRAIQQIAKKKK